MGSLCSCSCNLPYRNAWNIDLVQTTIISDYRHVSPVPNNECLSFVVVPLSLFVVSLVNVTPQDYWQPQERKQLLRGYLGGPLCRVTVLWL
jgi:hypothetical protein